MEKTSLHYVLGAPYYAVQFDFIRAGKRCRLYADLKEKVMRPAVPRTLNEAAAYFCEPAECDFALLSSPQTDLKKMQLTPLKHRQVECAANAVYAGRVYSKTRKFTAVIDFSSDRERQIVLPVKMVSSKDSSVWLNGKKLPGNKRHKVKLYKGVNRLVFTCPGNRSGSIALPLDDGVKLIRTSEQ